MAAWIELHVNLPTHKKTRRLARLLGLSVPQDIPQVVGYLCVFWSWSIENASDGALSGFDAQDVADAAGWMGDPDVFLGAMIESGFLDDEDDGLFIHDWLDYAGRYLEYKERVDAQKQKNRERQKRFRERKIAAESDEPKEEPVLKEKLEDPVPDAISAQLYDPQWAKVAEEYERNIGMLPMGTSLDLLQSYVDDLGAEVVCKAIEIVNKASPNNPHTYLRSILKKWVENDINTLDKVEAYTKDLERRIQQQRGTRKVNSENGPPAIEGGFY